MFLSRRILPWLLFFLVWGCQTVHAQAIRLDVETMPLEEALALLHQQAAIDFVYAPRLIRPYRVTCRYEGEDPLAALRCLLQETTLIATPGSDARYILSPLGDTTATTPPPSSTLRRVLAGFVLDSETQEVLMGAHIYVADQEVGAITNEAGYFALPDLPHGAHRIQISYLGYAVLDTVLATTPEMPLLLLQPTTLAGQHVVVEATHSERIDREGVTGMSAVPVQQLVQLPPSLGGRDLFQALQWLPGIQQSGEVRGGLVVRGSGPDQNLYLLDGAPIYHPWHAFSFISTFQTETFKNIRLYRGSFPAAYGGRLSSVLDAELKDGSLTRPRAVGALNPISGRFLIESPVLSNLSFMLSGRGSHIEKLIGREHPVEDSNGRLDTLRTGYYFYDWSAKVSYRPSPRSRLSVSYYQGKDDLDLRLPFLDLSLNFSSWLRPADLFFEVDHFWGNRLVSIRHQYLVSPQLFLSTTLYSSRYDAAEVTFIQPTSSASVNSDYEIGLRDIGLVTNADYYLSLTHTVQAGIQLVKRQFTSELDALVELSPGTVDNISQRSDLRATEVVGYVQDVWQPSARWQIQPGIRISFLGNGPYFHANPRLSLQYMLHPERMVLRAAWGTQVQYLQRLRDRYSFLYDLVSSRWVPASRSVQPSTGMQLASGVEYRPTPKVTMTGDVYWRKAEDILLPEDVFQTKDGLIGPGIETGTLLGQYTVGRARAWGVELSALIQQGPWRIRISYTGSRTYNQALALGENDFRPARFDVPRAFQSVIQWTGQRWGFALSSSVRSGYPHTVPVARYAIQGPLDTEPVRYLHRPHINNGRLPAYVRLDATAGYRFTLLGAQWQAQFHLYNATNRSNVSGRFYDAAQPVVQAKDRHDIPILPILELVMEL